MRYFGTLVCVFVSAWGHGVKGDKVIYILRELGCEHSDGCGVLYLLLNVAFSEGLLSLLSSVVALSLTAGCVHTVMVAPCYYLRDSVHVLFTIKNVVS